MARHIQWNIIIQYSVSMCMKTLFIIDSLAIQQQNSYVYKVLLWYTMQWNLELGMLCNVIWNTIVTFVCVKTHWLETYLLTLAVILFWYFIFIKCEEKTQWIMKVCIALLQKKKNLQKKCDRKNIVTRPGFTHISLADWDTLDFERS